MSSLRRVTALLSGLLLLQLTLFGQASGCSAHPASRALGGIAATQIHARHAVITTSHEACNAARSPRACVSMPACVTALAVPASIAVDVTFARTRDVLPEPASVRSELSAAPEVPPPRS